MFGMYPNLPIFNPATPIVLALLENKTFFCHIFIRKSQFSNYGAMKENKNFFFFPTYLPYQKIQGKSTANKQFFKDGLTEIIRM